MWHRDVYPLFEQEAIDLAMPQYELTCLVPMVRPKPQCAGVHVARGCCSRLLLAAASTSLADATRGRAGCPDPLLTPLLCRVCVPRSKIFDQARERPSSSSARTASTSARSTSPRCRPLATRHTAHRRSLATLPTVDLSPHCLNCTFSPARPPINALGPPLAVRPF